MTTPSLSGHCVVTAWYATDGIRVLLCKELIIQLLLDLHLSCGLYPSLFSHQDQHLRVKGSHLVGDYPNLSAHLSEVDFLVLYFGK